MTPSNDFMSRSRLELDEFISQWSLKITVFGALLVLLCTLYPFRFFIRPDLAATLVRRLLVRTDLEDFLVNVALFLPFGFGLGGLLRRRKLSPVTQFLFVLGMSAGLSLLVECLQLFLPGRSASLIDISTNGLGGLLGGTSFYRWGNSFHAEAMNLRKRGSRIFARLSIKHLTAAFLGYLVLVFGVVATLQTTTLSTWDDSYSLLLNSDRLGSSPWNGVISDVQIASRAVTRSEAGQILAHKLSSQLSQDFLIADFTLKGKTGYQDQSGHLPDLVEQGTPATPTTSERGVDLNENRWFETSAAVSPLVQAVRDTSQFTMLATIAPTDIEHARGGMAPILAIANQTGEYNFILGQKGRLLVFWLRTSLNTSQPGIPDGFIGGILTDTTPRRLLITYSGLVLRIYTDRSDDQYSFYLLSTNPRVISVGIIFAPLGFLLTLMTRKLKGSVLFYICLLFCGTILPPVLLEGLLISLTQRNISWENLLLAVLVMVSSLLVFQKPPVLQSKQSGRV